MENANSNYKEECKVKLKFLDYFLKSQCSNFYGARYSVGSYEAQKCNATVKMMEKTAKECLELHDNDPNHKLKF